MSVLEQNIILLGELIQHYKEYIVVYSDNILNPQSHYIASHRIFESTIDHEIVECWVFDIEYKKWNHCATLWSEDLQKDIEEFIQFSKKYRAEEQYFVAKQVFYMHPMRRGMYRNFFSQTHDIPMINDLTFNSQEFLQGLERIYDKVIPLDKKE